MTNVVESDNPACFSCAVFPHFLYRTQTLNDRLTPLFIPHGLVLPVPDLVPSARPALSCSVR